MRQRAGQGANGSKSGEDSSEYHRAHTVEDLTRRNIQTIAQLEAAARADRSAADRIADAIAAFCGGMTFIYVHLIWFGGWVLINTLPFLPRAMHFDRFPFQFLTLVVSLEAIFLSAFILISQNRQGRLAERRNHLDLQINLLSEQENSKMLVMLDALLKHHGIQGHDPEVAVLETSTHPDKMVAQIEEIIEQREAARAVGEEGSGS